MLTIRYLDKLEMMLTILRYGMHSFTSDPSSVSKIFNHRLQVSSDGKVWFTLYDSRYQQSGGYKETPNGKTYYINDTSINDTFSSVQQKIDGITTTIQNVEENLKTEINESANGFNVNIQRISQDLENAKSALNNAIDSLNTSFNVELGKITGIIEGIDKKQIRKYHLQFSNLLLGGKVFLKSMECLKMGHL